MLRNLYQPSFGIKDAKKNGLKVTYITEKSDRNRKVEIWHPNKFHSDFHIEFAHTTITGVSDLDTAISKATKLLWEYPML